MLFRNTVLSICLLCSVSNLNAQSPAEKRDPKLEGTSTPIQSEIRQVTLYRDQALVTRELKIPIGRGVREFVIRGLPPLVVLHSLFAESSGLIEARGLRISLQELAPMDPLVLDQRAQELTKLGRERSAAERRLQSFSKTLVTWTNL